MRYSFLSLILLASTWGCSDSDVEPDPKPEPTATDLRTALADRSRACGERQPTLEDCTTAITFLKCGYTPDFLRAYTKCRQNPLCQETATHAACTTRVGQAEDESASALCIDKANACEGASKWNAELCSYPSLQPIYGKRVKDCLALATCAEQKTCMDGVIDTIDNTCPKLPTDW